MQIRRQSVQDAHGRPFELVTLFAIQPLRNNVYLLVDPDSREGLFIDASEAAPIFEAVADLKVKRILLTHGHRDHQAELPQVREKLKVPVGIGAGDVERLSSPPDFTIADGDRFRFGELELLAISTPGHTPGSTCFHIGDAPLSGDTLFPGGPGATRNPGSNFQQIMQSLRTRLFTLPDVTGVFPGHGEPTTLGRERPYLDEWQARGW